MESRSDARCVSVSVSVFLRVPFSRIGGTLNGIHVFGGFPNFDTSPYSNAIFFSEIGWAPDCPSKMPLASSYTFTVVFVREHVTLGKGHPWKRPLLTLALTSTPQLVKSGSEMLWIMVRKA